MLCMLETVEGGLCSLEVLWGAGSDTLCATLYVEGRLCLLEVMRCMLLRMLEDVEAELCLRWCRRCCEARRVLEVPEAMRCLLLCTMRAVEGGLYLPEMEVLEAMRRVLLSVGGRRE